MSRRTDFCGSCGKEMFGGAVFCTYCGSERTDLSGPPASQAQPEVLEIKKIGIWSLVKLFFMINALVGLLVGILIAAVGMSGLGMGELPFAMQGAQVFGTGALIVFMLAVPILYGLMGAVFGLISGGLYNILAWGVGGIRLTLNRS